MDKIKEMGEGIVVQDAPVRRSTIDELTARGKRAAANGKAANYRGPQCVMGLRSFLSLPEDDGVDTV